MATKATKTSAAKDSGTAVAVRKPNAGAVVSLQDQLKKEAEALGSRIKKPGGDKIKLTKKKTFKLPDGTESEGPLSVVILDFAGVNVFHDKPYKEGEITSPACFAAGFAENDDLVPTDKSPDKQADKCGECPNNAFGSKGNGKACSNKRLLALVAGEGDLAADANAPMWVIEVSATGLKAYDAYVSTVRREFGLPPIGVVTDIFFDPTSDFQSLRFGNPQPNPNLEVHFARRAAAQERLLAEPDFSKYVPLKQVKKPAKK